MEEVSFGAKPGEPVPEADTEDMKNLWLTIRDVKATGGHAVSGWEHSLKPGADPAATRYRTSMLRLLMLMPPVKELLSPWIKDDQPTDALFQVAAKIPMEGIKVGVVSEGLPLDLEDFIKRCSQISTAQQLGQP